MYGICRPFVYDQLRQHNIVQCGPCMRNMVTWLQTCHHIPAIELELQDVVETKIKIYTHAVDAIIGDECACTF